MRRAARRTWRLTWLSLMPKAVPRSCWRVPRRVRMRAARTMSCREGAGALRPAARRGGAGRVSPGRSAGEGAVAQRAAGPAGRLRLRGGRRGGEGHGAEGVVLLAVEGVAY